MYKEFVKGQSDNLPKIDKLFLQNRDFIAVEMCGVKALKYVLSIFKDFHFILNELHVIVKKIIVFHFLT